MTTGRPGERYLAVAGGECCRARFWDANKIGFANGGRSATHQAPSVGKRLLHGMGKYTAEDHNMSMVILGRICSQHCANKAIKAFARTVRSGALPMAPAANNACSAVKPAAWTKPKT